MDDGKVILGFDPGDPEGRLVLVEKGGTHPDPLSSNATMLAQERPVWAEAALYGNRIVMPVFCPVHGAIGEANTLQHTKTVYDIQVAHLKEMHPRRYYQLKNS